MDDFDRLKELCEKYPEVRQLLRDNYALSVQALSHRLEAIEERLNRRVDTFDANHTKADARLTERLDKATTYTKGLELRIYKLEQWAASFGEDTGDKFAALSRAVESVEAAIAELEKRAPVSRPAEVG